MYLLPLLLAAGQVMYPDHGDLTVFHRDDELHRIKSADDWSIRRTHVLKHVELVMGGMQVRKAAEAPDVKYGATEKLPKFTRTKLTFDDGHGGRVPGWLLVPTGAKGKMPAMLCLHQTVTIGKDEPAGLGKREELQYGVHLAERGYVCLCPDYPSFGEYKYDFAKCPYPSGSMKAISDNVRAVDVLASLPSVDENRIGVIGHSLGGHNAMFTAVFDTRLKAVVSNCGFTSFPKYYGGNLKGWTSDRYMPRIAKEYDSDPKKVPFDFPEIVACIAPRAFLASSPTGDDNFEVSGVKDCVKAAKPIYELLGAKDKLEANYPECKHNFPPEVRKVAYAFLDRHLKR